MNIRRSPSLDTIDEAFSFSVRVRRTGDNGTILARRLAGTGDFLYRFFVTDGKPGIQIGSPGGAQLQAVGLVRVPSGVWIDLAAVYDGAAVRVYLHGFAVGSERAAVPLARVPSPLTVGARAIASGEDADDRFAGEIDELAVYDRALSEREVRALVEGALPPGR